MNRYGKWIQKCNERIHEVLEIGSEVAMAESIEQKLTETDPVVQELLGRANCDAKEIILKNDPSLTPISIMMDASYSGPDSQDSIFSVWTTINNKPVLIGKEYMVRLKEKYWIILK